MSDRNENGSSAPFGVKLEATLTERAARASLPRVYVAIGDVLQDAARGWLSRFGATLSDEQRRAWNRQVETMDSAVLELGFGPSAAAPRLLTPDSPVELALAELSALALCDDAAREAGPEGAAEARRAALEREQAERSETKAAVRKLPVAGAPGRRGGARGSAASRKRPSRSERRPRDLGKPVKPGR